MVLSCSDLKVEKADLVKMEELIVEVDSLKAIIAQKDNHNNQISTFLTFQDNNAEQAMKFYVDLFDNSKIVNVKRWGAGSPGKKGAIMHAIFEINGRSFMCSDSPLVHDWDFSPAVSNYVACSSENELERLFSKLSENGTVTMPLNNYGFSTKFGWVIDQFGVSWQLNFN